MKFCSNCGTKLNPGAAFCPHCGAKVEQVKPAKAFEITRQFWLGFYLTLVGGVAAGIAVNVDTLTTLVPSTIIDPVMTLLIIIACAAIPGVFTLITGIIRGFNHRRTGIGQTVIGMALLLVAGSLASVLFAGEYSISSSTIMVVSLFCYFIASVIFVLAYFTAIFVTSKPAAGRQIRQLRWAVAGMTVVAVLLLAALLLGIVVFLIAALVLVGAPFLGRNLSLSGGSDWRLLTHEHGRRLSWRFYLALFILVGGIGLRMANIYQAAGVILTMVLIMAAEWWSNPQRLGKQPREMAGCLLVVAILLQVTYLSLGSRMDNAWPIVIAIFILMAASFFTYFYVILRTRFVVEKGETGAK